MSENGATRTPLLEFRGINTHYGAVHIPVSYTHLTLPTICSV